MRKLPSPRCRFVLGIFRAALCSEMECNQASSCLNIPTMHTYALFYRNMLILWVQRRYIMPRTSQCLYAHAHMACSSDLCSPLEVTAPEWRLLQGLNIYVCMYTGLLLSILGEFQMNENCVACALRCIPVYDVTAWSWRAVISLVPRPPTAAIVACSTNNAEKRW